MSADKDESGMAGNEPLLLRSSTGRITVLTLNASRRRNCLSEAMISELQSAFCSIAEDKEVRAVVLKAEGPAFCAGHDLKELTSARQDEDGGRAYFKRIMVSCSDMMQSIVALPVPIIAAVQGVATAAGCQLVATCDLAVASSEARFATPGVNIGLFCSTPMVALSRNVHPKHAMEMLLTGELISAQEAMRTGLVNKVVSPGTEFDEAMNLAGIIASKSPYSVRVGKLAFYQQLEMGLAAAYSYTSDIMVENLLEAEAKEGICAFVEKRKPNWSGIS